METLLRPLSLQTLGGGLGGEGGDEMPVITIKKVMQSPILQSPATTRQKEFCFLKSSLLQGPL